MASDYGRKVARAARTGGGVTARGARPWGWYFILIAIFAIGIPLIAVSRQSHIEDAHPDGTDHWHTAYAFDVCGKFLPVLKDDFAVATAQGSTVTPPALHTHGDGVVHIEPYVLNANSSTYGADLAAVSGKNATFGKFVTSYNSIIPGLSVTPTSFQVPGETTAHKNGDLCGTKPGVVQVAVWKNADQTTPTLVPDANKIKLKNGMVVTIALVPKGTTIPKSSVSLAGLRGAEGLKPGQHVTASTTTTKKK